MNRVDFWIKSYFPTYRERKEMKRIYCVRDILAGEYVGQPLFFAHDAAAVRFFSDAVRDEKTYIAKYPDDHVLCCLGFVDADTGAVGVVEPSPSIIITGSAVKAMDEAKREASVG